MIAGVLLLAVGLIVAVVAAIYDRHQPWGVRLVLAVCAVVAFVLGGVRLAAERDESARERMYGHLEIPQDAERPCISIGGARLHYNPKEPGADPGLLTLEQLGVNFFGIGVRDKKFLVNAEIRGADGLIIARLSESDWIVDPGRALDRNYNHRALEVVDSAGDVILQLYQGPQCIHAAVKSFMPDGTAYVLAPAEYWLRGSVEGLMFARGSATVLDEFRFEPIFRYPSSLYLGELARDLPQ